MTTTATEATREELIAEYVIRDAVFYVSNRIHTLFAEEEIDIYERLPGINDEELVPDAAVTSS